MSIVLFAIIGATINAGAWYWICFGGYCLCKAIGLVLDFVKGVKG